MSKTREELIAFYKARTEHGGEVNYTEELERVLNLPMRDWEKRMGETQLHPRMTNAYKQPRGQQVLRPIQAAAIADLHDHRGLLAPIGVGQGKTLISFLAPLVLSAARPILLVPAALKEKTYREFAALRWHWIGHPSTLVESYEMLSQVNGLDILNNYQPDMIICDEVHRLKNLNASVTRRVNRYMQANPSTIFAGMSGSIMKRSLMDFWHLAYWALRHKMPLPRDQKEAETWASVLDELQDVGGFTSTQRPGGGFSGRKKPGALNLFCEDLTEDDVMEPIADMFNFAIDGEKREKVRRAFQKRFRSSPGIVCSGAEKLDCSLSIEMLEWPIGTRSQEAIKTLKSTGYTPSGDLVSEASVVWMMTLELACGFYYRWDPPAPMDWLTARRNWNAAVRAILEKHIPGLDSPLQVERALTFGRYEDKVALEAYQDWVKIQDTFQPNQVAEWLDDSVALRCAEWMKKTKGIVWTQFNAFGEHLSRLSGVGFCAEQGCDANGRPMEDYAGGPVIASIMANSTGRNLQDWNQNLVVTPPSNGLAWEQLLGRTHRQGQKADNVYYAWVNLVPENEKAFRQAVSDARTISTTVGPKEQRILYADHIGFSS